MALPGNLIDSATLSDLFFNHEHAHLETLWFNHVDGQTAPSDEETHAALLADAREFKEHYENIVPLLNEATAEDIAKDYWGRV